jgi:hypothetical protein
LAQFLLYIYKGLSAAPVVVLPRVFFFGGALFILAFDSAILDLRRYLYLHIQAAFERGYLV